VIRVVPNHEQKSSRQELVFFLPFGKSPVLSLWIEVYHIEKSILECKKGLILCVLGGIIDFD
jgi:hypothetical protein